ncbi:MAG TPA: hypothetical protein DIU07_02605 [Rhodobacteraceae bacterium]|nr:hypothetical protein [Paracoccaceae bacterium]
MHVTEARSAASESLAFALKEREHCLSDREWRHRLHGYGYDVRQTADGRVLTLLATGATLGRLDLP